jgi:peptidyl-prolyl cis-trans isomerase B (cyclophilin B)
MGGKQAKRELRRQKDAVRQEARRKQRQQTLYTVLVIALIVAIGGVLVWLSLDPAEPDLLAEDVPPEEETPLVERPVACGGSLPEQAGEPKPTYDDPEQVLEEGVGYRAVVETSCGTVVIDLDAERAPETVNSFVFLARQGFFDGLAIFRNATTIGALQTGAGTNEATWSIGYTVTDELEAAEGDGYPPGAVAMANSGPDTAGSQLFLVYNDLFQQGVEAGTLPAAYTRFGLVTAGLDVLEEIGHVDTDGARGETPTDVAWIERVIIDITAPTPEQDVPPADEPEDAPTEGS